MFNKKKNEKKAYSYSGATLEYNAKFAISEAYKSARTNMLFSIASNDFHTVVFTSCSSHEGKSTTAVNLSYVLAENGKKVLLVDADLRIPSIAKKMDMNNSPGLTDFLMDYENQQLSVFKSKLLDNWYILPSGNLPPNPSELLGSRRMEQIFSILSEKFDYIVVDLPPVNVVSDALAISNLITGMVVVIREEYTSKRELEACFRQLKLSNVKVLGCVLNGAKSDKGGYGRYKKYYKYYKNEPYAEVGKLND